MEKSIVCINCPIGCRLTAQVEDGEVVAVSGNSCRRGVEYARQEVTAPVRVLTGNMKARGCRRPFAVRTDKPVPRESLPACALELKRHHPIPPVSAGDIVIENILGTECNVVVTQEALDLEDETGGIYAQGTTN